MLRLPFQAVRGGSLLWRLGSASLVCGACLGTVGIRISSAQQPASDFIRAEIWRGGVRTEGQPAAAPQSPPAARPAPIPREVPQQRFDEETDLPDEFAEPLPRRLPLAIRIRAPRPAPAPEPVRRDDEELHRIAEQAAELVLQKQAAARREFEETFEPPHPPTPRDLPAVLYQPAPPSAPQILPTLPEAPRAAADADQPAAPLAWLELNTMGGFLAGLTVGLGTLLCGLLLSTRSFLKNLKPLVRVELVGGALQAVYGPNAKQAAASETPGLPPAEAEWDPFDLSAAPPPEARRRNTVVVDELPFPLPALGPTFSEQQEQAAAAQRLAEEAILEHVLNQNIELQEQLANLESTEFAPEANDSQTGDTDNGEPELV